MLATATPTRSCQYAMALSRGSRVRCIQPRRRSSSEQCVFERAALVDRRLAVCFSSRSKLVARGRHGAAEPGSGVGPVAVCGARRDLQRLGSLVSRQTGKVAELDKFHFFRMGFGEAIESLVEGQKLVIGAGAANRSGSSSCRLPLPPRFMAWRRRACSTRIRRIASAAAAKKCRCPSNRLLAH